MAGHQQRCRPGEGPRQPRPVHDQEVRPGQHRRPLPHSHDPYGDECAGVQPHTERPGAVAVGDLGGRQGGQGLGTAAGVSGVPGIPQVPGRLQLVRVERPDAGVPGEGRVPRRGDTGHRHRQPAVRGVGVGEDAHGGDVPHARCAPDLVGEAGGQVPQRLEAGVGADGDRGRAVPGIGHAGEDAAAEGGRGQCGQQRQQGQHRGPRGTARAGQRQRADHTAQPPGRTGKPAQRPRVQPRQHQGGDHPHQHRGQGHQLVT